MNPRATVRRLDQLIQSRSILGHPFYVAWQRGELTQDQLATYTTAYYPHVAAFPRYLTAAANAAEDPRVRAELEHNLADELSHPKPHPELWLDFAAGLGLDRDTVATAAPRPATENIVATFDRLVTGGTARALAALYAYESQQPEVSREKADGLRRHYGVRSPDALAYFDIHAETDRRHRDGERRALAHCLAAGAAPDAVLDSAQEALDAYWGLLDGICEDAAIPLSC